MATLYVTEPGARIEKEYRRILVTKEDEVLMAVPLSHVSEVVLVGWAGATTPAMLSLLDNDAGLSLVTRSGRLRGRLVPAEARNLPLRRKQYTCAAAPEFCLGIGRSIVEGKLKNSRTMLRRMLRAGRVRADEDMQERGERAIARLNQSLDQIPSAPSLAELRGLEGIAAKAYFSVLRSALRPELSMDKRTRRPPKDPANALLSLAYSLLTNAMFTACEIAGLDPYEGFFHADKYGRPALALDLVEEFRSIIADSIVLSLINNRRVRERDFEAGRGNGIYLTKKGMRAFLYQYTRRLLTRVHHPLAGRSLSYQKVFEVQARQLRKAIESGRPEYGPIIIR